MIIHARLSSLLDNLAKKDGIMKRTLIILLSLVSPFLLNAQIVIDWQQCYGGENNDKAEGIVEVEDGFLVCGTSKSPNSGLVECDFGNYSGGAWLIKINQVGDLIWNTCFDRCAKYVKSNGNIYLVGGGPFFETNKLGLGIRRIDKNGNTIWVRLVGNENYDFTYGADAVATVDGGVVGCANPCHQGGDISRWYGGYDGWLIKLDSLGNTEWDVTMGTDRNDFVYDVYQTQDEGYLAFLSSTSGGMPGSVAPCKPEIDFVDAMVVKVSKDGEIEWNRCYGGTGTEAFNYGIETNDGYLLVGNTNSDDGDLEGAGYHLGHYPGGTQPRTLDIWLLRLDSDGNIIWSKCYGGAKTDTPNRVFQNEDGGFTVFGNSESLDGDVQSASDWPANGYQYHERGNIWTFRVDGDGNLLWERAFGSRYGAPEVVNDVVKHNDREYTVAGYAPNWSEFEYFRHGDFECTNNFLCGEPGNAVYWVLHLRDVYDYDAVGENNTASESFKIYPIPTSDILIISGGEEEYHWVLYNSIGQRVLNGSAQNERQINVSGLSKGIYFLKINTMTRIATLKVLIE